MGYLNMQRRRIQRAASVGLAAARWLLCGRLLAPRAAAGPRAALVVEQRAQRHAQRERIDVPAALPAGRHPGLQVDPARHDGQLRRWRLGQGALGPGLRGRPVRRLGLADPVRRDRRTSRARRCCTSRSSSARSRCRTTCPGVSNLKLDADGHREHLPGQDHEVERPGDQGDQPRGQAAQHPDHLAVRSDSSGTTANFSLFLQDGRAKRLEARHQLDHQLAVQRRGPATATAGWRRSSRAPPGPSGTWTTPTPRRPG